MRSTALITTVTAVTLALAPVVPAVADDTPSPATAPTEQETASTTDRMIIKYHQPVAEPAQQQLLDEAAEQAKVPEVAEAEQVRTTADEAVVVELPEAVEVEELEQAAAELAEDPAVAYAEPDRLVSVAAGASDTYFGSLWGLQTLGAPAAWDTNTGRGMTIGVVDTGFAPHADLGSNVIGGYDFISTTNLSNDGDGRDANATDAGTFSTRYGQCYYGSATNLSSWHGTHVAGTAAAKRNNGGVVGVAPDATLLNARALGACGYGHESDIADAVTWLSGSPVTYTDGYGVRRTIPAPAKRADVINLSLTVGGACSATLQGAFNTATARNIPVVVAAGNQGRNADSYAPANCQNVLTVGAATTAGWMSSYSNWGDSVHVMAPGDSILSTADLGQYGPQEATYVRMSGTSMATPHVSGAVALIRQKNPTLSPARIKQIIMSTTNNTGGDPDYPVVSVSKALAATPKLVTTTSPAPSTPIYTTKGAINSFYLRNKTALGNPTSHETKHGAGVYQSFQKGTVYWSGASGTQMVAGGVQSTFHRTGRATGALGFPTSPERSNGIGGAYQLFQRGKVIWGPSTGGYAVVNGINSAYTRAGSEKGALGYPTSEERSDGKGGAYQTFQKGRIVWSAATGSVVVKNAINSAYVRAGSAGGKLGYPTAAEGSDGHGGAVQPFQGGKIVWSSGAGSHPLLGAIGARSDSLGGVTGKLGYPTTDEKASVNGGVVQGFQRGNVYWAPGAGTRATYGAIGVAYADLGGPAGRLGYPTSEEYRSGTTTVQNFQGGKISWASGRGVRIDYR